MDFKFPNAGRMAGFRQKNQKKIGIGDVSGSTAEVFAKRMERRVHRPRHTNQYHSCDFCGAEHSRDEKLRFENELAQLDGVPGDYAESMTRMKDMNQSREGIVRH
ncbi:hypothetical protein B9Z55_027085 [Caenorhabditis nigoni]|uniref:Uncharacterized protein n=1 Tax=Caenorhabditis nigoni TaxID=1611254 RepID=A0A2G5SJA2_9PELO|nr:hypothetical protein B9Z55_027085 [Caenorhabditis nigoni]